MCAAGRFHGDRREAVGAVPGRRRNGARLRLPLQPVHLPDQKKDDEGDDQEVQDRVEEQPVRPEDLEALGVAMGFADQPRQELEEEYLRVTRRARKVAEPLIYG